MTADERVREQIEQARRRREAAKRVREEFAQARARGLEARHAAKLAHLDLTPPPQTGAPHDGTHRPETPPPMTEPENTWLAVAHICGCDRVAVILLDQWKPGADTTHRPGQAVAVGTDWSFLVTRTALDLHNATGRDICTHCTCAPGQDPGHRNDITATVTTLAEFAALADRLGIRVTHQREDTP